MIVLSSGIAFGSLVQPDPSDLAAVAFEAIMFEIADAQTAEMASDLAMGYADALGALDNVYSGYLDTSSTSIIDGSSVTTTVSTNPSTNEVTVTVEVTTVDESGIEHTSTETTTVVPPTKDSSGSLNDGLEAGASSSVSGIDSTADATAKAEYGAVKEAGKYGSETPINLDPQDAYGRVIDDPNAERIGSYENDDGSFGDVWRMGDGSVIILGGAMDEGGVYVGEGAAIVHDVPPVLPDFQPEFPDPPTTTETCAGVTCSDGYTNQGTYPNCCVAVDDPYQVDPDNPQGTPPPDIPDIPDTCTTQCQPSNCYWVAEGQNGPPDCTCLGYSVSPPESTYCEGSNTCSVTNEYGTCTGIMECSCTQYDDGCFTWSECSWATCSARTPREESCNGVDDDCDGTIDEGNVCGVCTPGEQRTCGDVNTNMGQCQIGKQLCLSDGQWGDCGGNGMPAPIGPTEEICDQLDNDCDGTINEDLLGDLNPNQLGVCENSRMECSPSVGWVESYDNVKNYEPLETTCDGLDNDCDGTADGMQRSCSDDALIPLFLFQQHRRQTANFV